MYRNYLGLLTEFSDAGFVGGMKLTAEAGNEAACNKKRKKQINTKTIRRGFAHVHTHTHTLM